MFYSARIFIWTSCNNVMYRNNNKLNISDCPSTSKRIIVYILVEVRRICNQHTIKTTSFFAEIYFAFCIIRSPFITFDFKDSTYNPAIYA